MVRSIRINWFIWTINCGIIFERSKYRPNPVVIKTIRVEANLVRPCFSRRFTSGMKINARRIEKIRMRTTSESRKIRIKNEASVNIHPDILIIRFRVFSVI
jgi:hypothetical protein